MRPKHWIASGVVTVTLMGTLWATNPTDTADPVAYPNWDEVGWSPNPDVPARISSDHTWADALRQFPTESLTPEEPEGDSGPATISIQSYAECGDEFQSCIDQGSLTQYHGFILAGHNYMGWQWLSRIEVGTRIEVAGGEVAGTYEVFDHLYLDRQGGNVDFSIFRGADLVLQACEGDGTGFSLARTLAR